MAKNQSPPSFLKPGDDPEVDALLTRLKKDGDDGDPLYVNFKKRRVKVREGHVEPQPVALDQGRAPAPPSPTPASATPRWLAWAMVSLSAPVLCLTIGVLWSKQPPASPMVASATASAGLSAAAGADASVKLAPSAASTAAPEPRGAVGATTPENERAPVATAEASPKVSATRKSRGSATDHDAGVAKRALPPEDF